MFQGVDFDKQICRALWCFDAFTGQCVSSGGAAHGTTCGNKQVKPTIIRTTNKQICK